MSKEGSDADHMVTIFVGGASVAAGEEAVKEAWRCDTRRTPILAIDTTELAIIAVRRAIAGKSGPEAKACCVVS